MVLAAQLSGIDSAEIERLRTLIASAGLPVDPPVIAAERWLAAMGMDKKVQRKKLRFVLLRGLGDAVTSTDYDADRLQALIGDR